MLNPLRCLTQGYVNSGFITPFVVFFYALVRTQGIMVPRAVLTQLLELMAMFIQ